MTNAIAELTAGFEEPFARLCAAAAGGGAEDRRAAQDAVVVSWPSVPAELVRAAGFRPVYARGSARPTPAADAVLEPDLFPSRLRQLVEAALARRLHHAAAIVLPRTSDPDYKCFLYLRELGRRGARLPPVLLYDLLQSSGPEVREHSIARTGALLARLADISGRPPEANALRNEILSANRSRAAARRLDRLRSPQPHVSGVEAMTLLGARWQVEPERYAELADSAAAALADRAPVEGPRVLLAGAPVDTTALHSLTESAGAVVVAEMSPYGSGGVTFDVRVGDDPVTALADHAREASLDARMPVASLIRRVEDALAIVDAVVVSLPPGDQSFGWDYPRLRALFERRAVPHAVVCGDPAMPATDADRKAIQSLVARLMPRREARHG